MADAPHILVRQSPRALGTPLRFASRACGGSNCRELMARWRDAWNNRLSTEQLRREGKVASVPLSDELLAEYAAHRARFRDWVRITPPTDFGLHELTLVPEDERDGADGADGADDAARPRTSRHEDDGSAGADAGTRPAALDVACGGTDAPSPRVACGGGCYARQPALHGRSLAFVSDGDVWVAQMRADAAPDPAGAPLLCARLTACGGCSHPRFSPDGRLIAYSCAPTEEDADAPQVHGDDDNDDNISHIRSRVPRILQQRQQRRKQWQRQP